MELQLNSMRRDVAATVRDGNGRAAMPLRDDADTPKTDCRLHAVHLIVTVQVIFTAVERLVSPSGSDGRRCRRGATVHGSDDAAHVGAARHTLGPNGGTSRSPILPRSARNGSAGTRGQCLPFSSRPRASDDELHGKCDDGT